MKKIAEISIWTSLVLCLVNILCLAYNTYQYLFIPKWFELQEIFVMLVFMGLPVLFFSYIIIFLSVVLSLIKQSNTFLSGTVLLIIGTISFIAMFFQWAALTDIIKEYPAGLEINNELKAIWISHILNFLYIISSTFYLIRVRKLLNTNKPLSSLISEQLFVSFNIIGIVCGITGLLIVLVNFHFRVNPQSYKWAIIPYSLFVFIPYLLVLSGWFFHAISNKEPGWNDKKQKPDIYKSSTFTLLVSIPIMVSLFFFNYNNITGIVSILWLPFYLFVVLFVLSISSLYNFKSN